MADQIIQVRWEKVVPQVLNPNVMLNIPADGSLCVLNAIGANANWNGIYKNVSSAPIALIVDGTNWADLADHLQTGRVVKLTPNLPPGVSIPASPLTGVCRPWVPMQRYMTGDRITINSDYRVYYVSAIDNNIQGVFKPDWTFGGQSPRNAFGLFTFPAGKLENMKKARREKGAPYFATDVKRLFVHSGLVTNDADLDYGFVPVMNIEDYDPALETTYPLGQLVHGFLRGRFRQTDWMIDCWGIFRKDRVPIWSERSPIHCPTDGQAHRFGAGDIFYIDGFTGALATANGVYLARNLIGLALTPNAMPDLTAELSHGNVRKMTEILPWQPNHVYNKGDLVYNLTYNKYYECNFNNYTSEPSFNRNALFLGWTCLADLFDTTDWPYRVPTYLHTGNKTAGQFPAVGQEDTIYRDTVTNRLWIWNGFEYIYISEDYPFIRLFETQANIDLSFSWSWQSRDFDEAPDHDVDTMHFVDMFIRTNETRMSMKTTKSTDPDPMKNGSTTTKVEFDFNAKYVESITDAISEDHVEQYVVQQTDNPNKSQTTHKTEIDVIDPRLKIKKTTDTATSLKGTIDFGADYVQAKKITYADQEMKFTWETRSKTDIGKPLVDKVKTDVESTVNIPTDEDRLTLTPVSGDTTKAVLDWNADYIESIVNQAAAAGFNTIITRRVATDKAQKPVKTVRFWKKANSNITIGFTQSLDGLYDNINVGMVTEHMLDDLTLTKVDEHELNVHKIAWDKATKVEKDLAILDAPSTIIETVDDSNGGIESVQFKARVHAYRFTCTADDIPDVNGNIPAITVDSMRITFDVRSENQIIVDDFSCFFQSGLSAPLPLGYTFTYKLSSFDTIDPMIQTVIGNAPVHIPLYLYEPGGKGSGTLQMTLDNDGAGFIARFECLSRIKNLPTTARIKSGLPYGGGGGNVDPEEVYTKQNRQDGSAITYPILKSVQMNENPDDGENFITGNLLNPFVDNQDGTYGAITWNDDFMSFDSDNFAMTSYTTPDRADANGKTVKRLTLKPVEYIPLYIGNQPPLAGGLNYDPIAPQQP